LLAFLGRSCGGVISEIEDFDNAPKSYFVRRNIMHITFENELGKVNLNDGIWRIKDIDGLGLIEKTVKVITYPDVDGQELVSAVTGARYITISGDIKRKRGLVSDEKRAMRIFYKPGYLKISKGTIKRRIFCRCTSFSAGTSDRNAVFQGFVIQLVCDYPFFEDPEDKKAVLFERENLILNSFTLPCVFTRRISRIKAVNYGDTLTRPKIYLMCEKAPSENGAIEIINHTNGKHFKLLYQMSKNEEIVIDFENRKVTSNQKNEENNFGNLIGKMSSDTFLSEFCFETGANDIECIFYGEGGEIHAFCTYSNKYIEAVI